MSRLRRALRIAARVCEAGTVLVCFGLLLLWCSVPDTHNLAAENPTTTAFIDLRREQAASAGKPFKLSQQWRPISKISRYLRASIIYAEDYNFYRHDGVDWHAIESAFQSGLDRGSFSIGGSTITQQLAKNLYLSPKRSFIRKFRELLIAYSLEDSLSKQRILEIYLNVVEWGDGVFGAEAAARHWFHKSAQSLTPAEAIRLAIALPNPFTRAPNIRSPQLTKKAVRITHLLRIQGLIDEAQERATLDAVGAANVKTLGSKKLDDVGAVLRDTQETTPTSPTGTSVDAAPADAAPSQAAPSEAAPFDMQPSDMPPAGTPPTEIPPTEIPPSDGPPADRPPAHEPPSDP
jgi:monofunctional biosynthetic peptidoglycan transglycosylase